MTLNIAMLLRESALRYPAKTALVDGAAEVSYDELWQRAQRLAGGLLALGVRPGHHIALLLPNTADFTVAYFAAHICGCPAVPLNIMLKAAELAYHLDDCDAFALIAGASYQEEASQAWQRSPKCAHFVIAGDTAGTDLPSLSGLVARGQPPATMAPTNADDTAVILYTSGTTGRPKGAELTHFNLLNNAEYILHQPVPVPPPERVALVALPLFHSFGQSVLQNAVLMGGGTVVLTPRFEALKAAELILKWRVNMFAGVPTMYYALLHHPDVTPAMLASLRHCICGGAPMPAEVMRLFDSKFAVDVVEAYGLSETSPVASFNPLGGGKKVGSIGLPVWGVEFRLIDDSGQTVTAVDTPGELCIKGPNVMKGYYKRADATAAALRDGWFHSGDIAQRDDDGFYAIVDRKKDLIIRGGFNVYPREIEEHLYAHPAVMEAAVIGVPHPSHGEEVQAFVVLRPDATCSGEDLVAYCKERLAAYKYPRRVEILAQLPKGPTGKILKRMLRS